MSITFPTTGSALIRLNHGDYNMVQLAKQVDTVVKYRKDKALVPKQDCIGVQELEEAYAGQRSVDAEPTSVQAQQGTSVAQPPDTGFGPSTSPAACSKNRPASLVHFHSHSLEISLVPPPATIRVWSPENNQFQSIASPDRERFNEILDNVKVHFSSATPFILLPMSDKALHVPVDKRGNAYIRAPGFQVLQPSNLKRQNVTPLLKNIVHSDTQSSQEWFSGSGAWDTRNWIQAAIAFDPAQPPTRKVKYRPEKQMVYMESELKACWVEPELGAADDDASLRLILDINIHLDAGTLFEPLTELGGDLMGFIYHSLIPSPTSQHLMSDSERRADSLRHFFTCVPPAPPLPYAQTLQPANMVSRLLPFQSRSVALLAQRERLQGNVPDHDPQGFWTTFQLDFLGKIGYRRITGQLVRLGEGGEKPDLSERQKGKAREKSPPSDTLTSEELRMLPKLLDLSAVRGTMLCEEMGLGKTVEGIALMLLNRHPLSTKRIESSLKSVDSSGVHTIAARLNPSQRRKPPAKIPTIDLSEELQIDDEDLHLWWDAEKRAFQSAIKPDLESGGSVSQVAATLIVTPPSLLKQWVTEMETHAPKLRVCVYEGWKSLLDGVAKRAVADKREVAQRVSAKRKRDNDRQRANTVRKYSNIAKNSAVKIEDEESDDSDFDDETTDTKGLAEDLQQRTQRLFVDFVRAHDVVITTYLELSKDLTVAKHAPPRARRSNVDYHTGDRPRSPLVMVEWWRVIMDEVQLCGDSSASANMVSLIPRQLSLAVSGTPARTDIKDLMGSLRFLRVPVLPEEKQLWHRLQQAPMRPAFDGLFQTIAIRTTKREVAGEFHLPPQTRTIIPIELSEIEMHYYNDTLERQRVVLGLPADATAPRPNDWYLQTRLFRSCLQNLRQICTHIQVGQMDAGHGGRGGGRLRLGRDLLTLSAALTRISEDHETERLLTGRAQLRAMIRKAQLLVTLNSLATDEGKQAVEAVKENKNRAILALYERAREKVVADLEPIRLHLDELLKAREGSLEDVDEESQKELSQQERDHVLELQRTRASIRELLLLLHQSWFLEGDYRHVQEEVEAEVNCYSQAEATRKEILARPLKMANASVGILEQKLRETQPVQSVLDLQTRETKRRPGMLSQEAITQSNELLKIMNENALLVCSWRDKIIDLLTKPIDPGNDLPAAQEDQNVVDPAKEQYAEALKAQGEVEAHLIAYAAAIADRREMLLEKRTLLATHEAKTKKTRTTKAAMQALANSDIPRDAPDDVAALAEELMAERQAMRDARAVRDCERPLKEMLMHLNNIIHGATRPEEVTIAQQAADFIRTYIKQQTDYVDNLNKELDTFRKIFNKRVVYFASLQEISDSVTPPQSKDLNLDIQRADAEIIAHEATLARSVVRGRYLKYLASRDENEDMRDDCLICMGSSDDDYGIFLDCGHFFCVSCFREFRKSAIGTKCPQCRATIEESLATRFKIGTTPAQPTTSKGAAPTAELKAADEAESSDPKTSASEIADLIPELSPAQREQQQRQLDLDRLNTLSISDRRAIGSMDMMGEFGSKINFLIKHLLWSQVKDETTRHVVFSNWSDSLRIVIQALQTNGIKFVAFDKGGRLGGDIVENFHKDESIKVFLLHAERESAGLTLTSCSTVHLLEPVLKHSFELQAIGRVDRLGQKQETNVYCYATLDTVESRILSQGVRNGTSIYLKQSEQGDRVVEDLDNVVSAAHKGGDIGLDGNEEEMLQLIML